jgi:hypothetical protein
MRIPVQKGTSVKLRRRSARLPARRRLVGTHAFGTRLNVMKGCLFRQRRKLREWDDCREMGEWAAIAAGVEMMRRLIGMPWRTSDAADFDMHDAARIRDDALLKLRAPQ